MYIQRNSKSKHAPLRLPIGIALCLTAVLGCFACTKSGQEEAYSTAHKGAPASPNDRAPLPSEVPIPPGAVRVTLMNMRIDMPSYLPAGKTTFSIFNDGTSEHNFQIVGGDVHVKLADNLPPNKSTIVQVDLPAGTYDVSCPVADHKQEGMSRKLIVQ